MIHLPSLAQLDRAARTQIWLCTGPTDMRRGFDRLAEQAQQVTRQHPQSGHLFVFRSRRGDRLKALYWDKDGYVLWYKRLGAPGEAWCFQRVKFPPRQGVEPLHRESSVGRMEVTTWAKRTQSDLQAVTRVKRMSLVR